MKLLFEVSRDVTGTGNTLFAWQTTLGNFLALSGSKNEVLIYNRQGQFVETIPLPGLCTSLDWDREGEYLAITQDYNGSLFLWNSNKHEIVTVDIGVKEGLTLALWAQHNRLLAIGTSKGNLILYNHRTRRKVPVIGKHSKKITSGVWSHQNVLALTGEDRKLTFSDQDGNAIAQKEIKFELNSLKFSPDGVMLIAIGGAKVLYLFEVVDGVSPLELVFEPQYGNITSYCWRDNEQIVLGFSKGVMVMISRKKDELGRELYQSRNFKDCLNDIDVAPSAPIVATSSDHQIKLHEFSNLEGMYGMFQIEDAKNCVSKLQWTGDSQLLTACLKDGGVMTFLVQLPQLGDCYDTILAYLTSLLQVNVTQIGSEDPPMTISCPIEPSFIAIGPTHLAVGMNNRIWFTKLIAVTKNFTEHSYIGTVSAVKLNEKYCAVLTNGSIELHLIESSSLNVFDNKQKPEIPESKTFPDEGDSDVITSFGLTASFLIYGTENGCVVHFCLEEWQYTNHFKHVIGISQIYPDFTGTKVVIVDDKCDAFLYSPVDDSLLQIPSVSPSVISVKWDLFPNDKYIFLCVDKEKVATYIYHQDTTAGACCVFVGTTTLPYGYKPINLYQGELISLTLTGKLNTVRLESHFYSDDQDLSESGLRSSFHKSLKLRKLKDAWSFASALDVVDCWQELVSVALHHFNINLAIHASQQIQDVSMVYSLKQIEFMEDRNLVAGHISLINNDYDKAQKLFLESSEPVTALEMRCDLLQWDQALELAKILAPERIFALSRQYAQQLEFIGDYGNALINYEKGITNDPKYSAHDDICLAGLARTSLNTGDMRRGIKLAQASLDNQLKKECAAILEGLKLFGDAGSLYEQAECWEEATSAFIKVKNWEKVGVLLSKLPQATKLQSQYAKAREADGHYQEAAVAYEKANDYDNAIRMYLDYLKLPDEAVRIVNDTHSIEGAKVVATFFQNINDYSSALKFLVLSQCNNEAYVMAQAYNQMDKYSDIIGDSGTVDDYLQVASYYQLADNPFKAGIFFLKAKEYKQALDHFLACPTTLFPDGENIEMAVKVVGAANQESLTAHLHSYLMGELDNEPKEARFLFGMYLSLKMYHKASQTAILIAKEDQAAGNYRNARDMLYQMYNELCEHNIKIPNEMKQGLMLLHSYLLVKIHVKVGAHEKAARLLVRVANNISKFPSHIVPILTSTVIECQRSGLKESAFTFAAMLMRPEYRSEIDMKWKKKLEGIVRKPERSEIEDSLSPCPVCSFMLPQMKLDCPQCKSTLPYCIVTGRHMVSEDWCECPSCRFPALFSQFKELLEADVDKLCPLCSAEISLNQLFLVSDIQFKLKSYTENFKY